MIKLNELKMNNDFLNVLKIISCVFEMLFNIIIDFLLRFD